MKTICKIFLIMAVGLSGLACQAKAPKGKLIYCSYARTGMAGLGKDYCELIADPGTEPKVKFYLTAVAPDRAAALDRLPELQKAMQRFVPAE